MPPSRITERVVVSMLLILIAHRAHFTFCDQKEREEKERNDGRMGTMGTMGGREKEERKRIKG